MRLTSYALLLAACEARRYEGLRQPLVRGRVGGKKPTSALAPARGQPKRALVGLVTGIRGGGGGEVGATVGLKAALSLGLTALNVGCWLGPLNLPSFVDSPDALGLANAFSGGVFLSLAFGHLLPHAIHELADLGAGSPEVKACAMTLAGYMLVFVVEKILFDTEDFLHHPEGPSNSGGAAAAAAANAADEKSKPKGLGAVLLLSALAVHSLVESAALGVQSSAKSAYLLAASIGLHQPAESVALLVALVKAGLPKRQIIGLLGAFSLVGPIGACMGVAAKEVVGGLVEPLLVALTAGTFLYVGATEVVGEEFEGHSNAKGPDDGASKGAKFLALSGGMAVIAAVIAVTDRIEASIGLGH